MHNQARRGPRPNILVFMTDQQHHETVGPAGFCRTPHLDAFMGQATTFTHAFTPTPICTPARASCQTGLLPHQHRLAHNTHRNYYLVADLPAEMPTLGSVLSASGYQTAYVGKWHVGRERGPVDAGYQRERNPAAEAGRQAQTYADVVSLDPDDPRCLLAATTDLDAERTEALLVAEATAEYVREMAGREEPFFLFASTTMPHVPWVCPDAYATLHHGETLAPWPNYADTFADKPGSYLRHYNKMNSCHVPGHWEVVASALTRYFGLVTLLDAAFGRILASLETAGCLDDTLIVFTADHGEMMGRHGLIGKDEYLLDDVVRIPLVVRRPGQRTAARDESFISLTDLFATCLDAAEVAGAYPRGQSRSLLPLLRGETTFPEEVFLEHHGSMFFNTVRGIRTRDFKYVFRPHEFDELYDLRQDPWERENRIDDPAYQEILATLRARLIARLEETGDMAAGGAKMLLQHAPAAVRPAGDR